ncbi:MAG TPA: CFI-box-CTERM domain-containing protein, partial [Solirubrobacterales bacterium]|nr:CFI-box-CTERM domain-containing protein [Solirubrobacterales bacterium]
VPVGGFLPEGGAGGCLIATAAFGSPLAPEVHTLRRFRDRALMTHAAGRALVRAYYWLSPPLARIVADQPVLASAVRAVLRPVARGAGLALDRPVAAAGLAAATLAAFVAGAVIVARIPRRSRGAALVGLAMGAGLLASALVPGERTPQASLPSPAHDAALEPDTRAARVVSTALAPTSAVRGNGEAGPASSPVAPAPPLSRPDLRLDLATVPRSGATSVTLLNPLAPRTARRWAVTSDLIEGTLGPEGFVVTDPGLARALGLEAGDTVVSIGGHPPRGLLTVMSALQRDPDHATVIVEIDRGGARLVYSYRVR